MRPFKDDGYWLLVPKPWKRRQFVDCRRRGTDAKKCKRLEKLVTALKVSKRNHRNNIRFDYTDGQSLFVLPKSLSRGVRLWKNYEARLKSWLDSNGFERPPTPSREDVQEAQCQSPDHELSALNQSSFYEEDPLRGFYTVWHCNTTKVSKRKIATTEKIYEYLDSLSKSDAVERCLSRPPSGGVSGRIDDPSSLSSKGRDTLQRWSRLVSHYDAGQESGEDEDPVEMWNRALENSILHNNSKDLNNTQDLSSTSLAAPNELSSNEIHNLSTITGSRKTEGSPVATSTAVRPKESRSRRISSNVELEDFPPIPVLHSASFHDSEELVKAMIPVVSAKLIDMSREQCENRPTPSRPDAADGVSELRRRSSRVFALKSMENTPVRRTDPKKSLEKLSSILSKKGSATSQQTTLSNSKDAQRKEIRKTSIVTQSPTICKSDARDPGCDPASASMKNPSTKVSSGKANTPKSASCDSTSATRLALRKRKLETPKSGLFEEGGTPENQQVKRMISEKSSNDTTPKTTSKMSASSAKSTYSADSAKKSGKTRSPFTSITPKTPPTKKDSKSSKTSASKTSSAPRIRSGRTPVTKVS